MSFENKVILITGASSGIGAACTVFLGKERAKLALVGRNQEKFHKVIEKIDGDEPLVILADITTDAERIITKTIEKYSRIDILINNAGFAIPAPAGIISVNDFDKIMATNVRAAIELSQLALPHLIESKGNILNMSSILSVRPVENLLSYCISKSALDQLTRGMALEFAAKGIRVNAVNPGFVITDFHHEAGFDKVVDYDAFVKKVISTHPLGRAGLPEDIAQAVAFLINDKSASFITGVCLAVDGGWNINTMSNTLN